MGPRVELKELVGLLASFQKAVVLASLCPKRGAGSSLLYGWIQVRLRRGVAQSGQRICFGYRGP